MSLEQGRIKADAIDANASVRKQLPMNSSVRFLPQRIRNNTFCENTRLIMHNFPRNDYNIFSNLHLKDLFSQKHALELLL